MHNSTNLLPGSRWVKRGLLLLGLLFGLGCQQAFALIQNNLACTQTGTYGVVDLGDLAPGEYFEVRMLGNCRVTRNFPYGSSLQQTQVLDPSARASFVDDCDGCNWRGGSGTALGCRVIRLPANRRQRMYTAARWYL